MALRQRGRGFTLLELIVTVALVSVVAAVMVGAFAAGFRVWERCRLLGRGDVDVAVALDIVERDIRNTVPCRVAAFRGESDWIETPCIVPAGAGSGTAGAVGIIRYEQGAGGGLDRVTTVLGWPAAPGERRETLVTTVDDVAFSFGDGDGAIAAWNRSWTGRTNLPTAVRITVTLREGGEKCERQRTIVLPQR